MQLATHQLRAFLTCHPGISRSAIEREAGIPKGTIKQVMAGRELPAKHIPALVATLRRYGLKNGLVRGVRMQKECRCIRFAGGDKWYSNGCTIHPEK